MPSCLKNRHKTPILELPSVNQYRSRFDVSPNIDRDYPAHARDVLIMFSYHRFAFVNLHQLLALFFLAMTAALAPGQSADAANTPTLYARMGGQTVFSAIANQLIDQTSSDPRLQRSFKGTDLPRIKTLLSEQLCALAGGPCQYSGDSMKEVHAGLDIKQGEFYGMVELLRQIMIANGVGLTERNEMLALLAPMKRDVVTK